MRKPINTELGVISGRNAIYLDEMKQELNYIIFINEINGNLCSDNIINKGWIPYTLSFNCPIYFVCCELDLYSFERSINSSFDIMEDSDLLDSIRKKTQREKLNGTSSILF